MQNSNSKNDLKERCFKFSLDVIALTNTLPNKRSAWVITDQLIRSATSIGANIIEARASSSRLEFKRFNEISLRSANETKYWLCLLKGAGLVSVSNVNRLLDEVTQLANMLASGILKLKNKNNV